LIGKDPATPRGYGKGDSDVHRPYRKELEMRGIIDIASSPAAEVSAELGTEGYWRQALLECRAYIALIRRAIGEEPAGARLGLKRNERQNGIALSVVCFFDTEITASVEYALQCASKAPLEWDNAARRELADEMSTRVER
jgi:hypothetical protein